MRVPEKQDTDGGRGRDPTAVEADDVDVLLETEVTPDQIDHLGHMNVSYYLAHARTGADHLLDSIGLVATDDLAVVHRDTYARHHHEQFVGSPLAVRGGVLDAAGDRVRIYEELVNTATGAIAATFVLTFVATDPATREDRPIATDVLDAAAARTVELPEHGRPRSLDLDDDQTAGAPSLATLRELDLAQREVRTIEPSLGDDDGYVKTMRLADLAWGGVALPRREFQPLNELADGGQMGFATMETRATWTRPARVGDRVQSFGAEIDIQAKTMITRHWIVDVDREDLVGTFTVVSLAFHTGERRAVAIPEDIRRRMARRLHPELAGGDPA
jgi:acyl-CoA thioester hydrolase